MTNDQRASLVVPAGTTKGARVLGPAVGAPVPDEVATPPPSPLVTARYQVIEELGRGQMGVVYRAIQTGLGREVAIKFPRLDAGVAPARFLRECKLLASVSHPNLVHVLDADLDGDRPYLVLEFVTGFTLFGYRESKGTLPIPEAVGLVCQALDGLATAHAAGIVHRDVKSANVLVTTAGVAKLADFGLASGEGYAPTTQAGALLGSPGYMSPEMIVGEGTTPRSDVYAFGIVLFELLTGRLPFTAMNAGELLTKHVRQVPPKLSKFVDEVPPELDDAVARCLAKVPADRYADAAEMGRALREALGLSASTSALTIPQKLLDQITLPAIGVEAAPKPRTRPVPGPGVRPPGSGVPRAALAGGVAAAAALVLGLVSFLLRPAPAPVVASPSPTAPAAPAAAWARLTALPPGRDAEPRWLCATDGAEMVEVPGGTFPRGTLEAGPEERPVREVHVDTFFIDRYEVTNRLFDKFCRETGRTRPKRGPGHAPELDRPDHPVVAVTWAEAAAYAAWAKKRLPTEAEWEKAARGADGRRYPWGNEHPGNPSPMNGSDPMSVEPDPYPFTAPVGKYPAGTSPYGVADMAGNVWEWCSDWYGDSFYAKGPDRNPTGPETGQWKITRGGGWQTYLPSDFLSAYRKKGAADARHLDQGFRCARPGS